MENHHQATHRAGPAYPVGITRRVLDVLVSAVMLAVLAPFLAVVAGLIMLTDGRPVFFSQLRVGEGGRPFRLYKLRTMRTGGTGPEVTASGDARVYPLGMLLRRTAIDELPQLWHVLTGQMTLVGPRPESDALAVRYAAPYRDVLRARPGLTGPAQLYYREHAAEPPHGWTDVESWYLTVLVPLRVAADLDYLRAPTLRRTVRFLVLTAGYVLGLAKTERLVTQTAVS
jgi:lipopolysaccharide/colanic/teichoic acid biosynthesis glycosyltransferase